jgi:uncharacterized protein (TIGR02598 family)
MKKSAQSAGFSLVEVSLALLVAAVGLVSMLALFPAGLEAARRADAETHEALFAEEVMSTYTALADVVPWNGLNSYKAEPAGPAYFFVNNVKILPNSGTQKIVYQDKNRVTKYAIRYELRIADPRANVKSLFLRVWGSEFGPTGDEDATTFYVEIFDRGVR